ncbi:alpha/beta hydrolase [Austwickia sp. TVS 96-490-7B]|uniref:alpha/beta hydrolase n=1 Tax=Austwickia sp. TVS 96-490-7B TaxID=2830843 RepID=UPI001C55C148|nr:alpha/beta hydrolase [Austwickia sp. TVS 96-490-7B]
MANRISLARDLERGRAWFEARGKKMPTTKKEYDAFVKSEVEAARELGPLRNAIAMNSFLTGDSDKKNSLLYAYEPSQYEGRGRAAVAFGDPDTAHHVAVCVPGLGSQVSKIDEVGGDAAALYEASKRADPTHDRAVIAWQGYDAPQLGVEDPLGVAHQDKALAGAHLLNRDVSAIAATRAGAGKLTVVGHSYGSTTTGLALQRDGMGARIDQAVLLGSPGVGGSAKTVADLGMSGDRVFVGSASRDLVTTGFQYLGHDPANEDFGATRFDAESPDRKPAGASLQDHSRYYERVSEPAKPDQDKTGEASGSTGAGSKGQKQIEKYSESLYSMGMIATGRGGELEGEGLTAPGRKTHVVSTPHGGFTSSIDPEWQRHPERYKFKEPAR